ncbi:MAG TPA: response regulator [Methylomirabilota bacterium]|nr:response regulator [Methylomirabilota bacterium]
MTILVVEDNPGDARLVKEAIDTGPVRSTVHLVEDGAAALAFLRRESAVASASRPDLVFLDLNLPIKTGWEVLAEMKVDPVLRRIPVMIWTSTRTENEVRRAYDIGASCYFVKPNDLDAYLGLVQAIVEFWLTRVRRAEG